MKPRIVVDSKHLDIAVTRLCYQLIEILKVAVKKYEFFFMQPFLYKLNLTI